ncbi:MAG TPA: efflux RND transporter permease subunit [Pirellulales bacterium]
MIYLNVPMAVATVVIGGLITSSLLTLLVLPAIYRWFDRCGSSVTRRVII